MYLRFFSACFDELLGNLAFCRKMWCFAEKSSTNMEQEFKHCTIICVYWAMHRSRLRRGWCLIRSRRNFRILPGKAGQAWVSGARVERRKASWAGGGYASQRGARVSEPLQRCESRFCSCEQSCPVPARQRQAGRLGQKRGERQIVSESKRDRERVASLLPRQLASLNLSVRQA